MEDRIKNAIEFIRLNLGRAEFEENVFISFLCGYFHTYPKKAKEIANIALDIGLMHRERKQSVLYWIINQTSNKTASIIVDSWGWKATSTPRRKRTRKRRLK